MTDWKLILLWFWRYPFIGHKHWTDLYNLFRRDKPVTLHISLEGLDGEVLEFDAYNEKANKGGK